MRTATIEEERAKFDKQLRQTHADLSKKLVVAQQQTVLAQQETDSLVKQRDEAVAQLTTLLGKKLTHIKTIITETNRTVHYVSVTLSCAIFLIAIILISNWLFNWLGNAPKLSLTLAVVTGAFGVYHQLANALELRKI